MTQTPPLLSVIVCSYTAQRLRDIWELLEALKGQSYRPLEVVFVADNAPELAALVEGRAREQGLCHLQVVLNDGRPGLAAARNRGVEQARGDVIAFIDDDALPFADWGEEIVRTLAADGATVGVTGPALPLWEDESLSWLPEEFYWLVSCPTEGWLGCRGEQEVRNAWGMNMAFRREAFLACRFPEGFGYSRSGGEGAGLDLLGEDTAFSVLLRQRTGGRIVFNPRVRVRHKVYRHRLAPPAVRRRAFWEGYTKAHLRRLARRERALGLDLGPEGALLRRIALGFLPRALAGLPRQPARSWRELRLAADALGHVALGYASALVAPLGRALCARYGR